MLLLRNLPLCKPDSTLPKIFPVKLFTPCILELVDTEECDGVEANTMGKRNVSSSGKDEDRGDSEQLSWDVQSGRGAAATPIHQGRREKDAVVRLTHVQGSEMKYKHDPPYSETFCNASLLLFKGCI